jgi:hypothetical protein
MTAKVESRWAGSADAATYDFVLTYNPGGGAQPPDNIHITTTCNTAAALAQAIEDAFDTATAGAGTFSVSVGSDGAYTIEANVGSFALTVNDPIQTFCGLDATYIAGQTLVEGDAYPPSSFYSLAPLPEPDPYFGLYRFIARSPGGRIESQLQDVHPMLPIALRFGPSTGQAYANIRAWLGYALRGIPFTVFRNVSDATEYHVLDGGALNEDGWSICILTDEGKNAARRWLGMPALVQGAVDIEARILDGY